MRIQQINSQNNFKAVNQKYYKLAEKEVKGTCRYGEILKKLRYEVIWKDISPQDGIDTVNAIVKLIGYVDEFTEHVLENFKGMLEK